MTPELTILALAVLLQVGQFTAFSIAANLQIGSRRALGTRDEPVHLTRTAGRLQRAMNNHFEALCLFTAAVVIVTFSDQSSGYTILASYTYLIARVLYVPAYVFGLVPWRSLIWAVGFGATVFIIVLCLL